MWRSERSARAISAILVHKSGMPEWVDPCGHERCNSCAGLDGPENGPLPTSHAEVCCLYKFARQWPSPSMLEARDGLCDSCPWNLKVQQQAMVPELAASTIHQPPQGISDAQGGSNSSWKLIIYSLGFVVARCSWHKETRRFQFKSWLNSLSCDAGIIPKLEEGATTPTSRPARPTLKKLQPRLRVGHKKKNIEIRPPRFKSKLWFGSYSDEELNLALDAVNYYTGSNLPFHYPESRLIFAARPLEGIKFEDVDPACDQYVQVGDEHELKYKNFAHQVKKVIHSVLGKQKKNPKRSQRKNPQTNRCGVFATSPASGSASSAVPCTSGVSISSETVRDKAHGSNTEASSGFSPPPLFSYITPPGMHLHEEEVSITELIIIFGWDKVFTPEELMYFNPSSVASSSFRGK